MRSVVARTVVAALAVTAALAGCGSDEPGELQGIVRSAPLVVGEVAVTDTTNGDTPFSFVAADGELLIVYFGYTNCPDLCPTTLAAIRSAKKQIGDDAAKVDLAMVTVDPDRDTAEVLNGYLSSFTDRFHALVPASPEELKTAEDAFLVTSEVREMPDGTIEVDHAANAFVVDDQGEVLVEWPFGHGVDGMVNDLQVLFDEMA